MIKSIHASDDPSVVTEAILSVIQSQQIRPRYDIGNTAKRLNQIRRFLPASLLSRLIQHSLKI